MEGIISQRPDGVTYWFPFAPFDFLVVNENATLHNQLLEIQKKIKMTLQILDILHGHELWMDNHSAQN